MGSDGLKMRVLDRLTRLAAIDQAQVATGFQRFDKDERAKLMKTIALERQALITDIKADLAIME